jgi:hypothetical protein
MAVMTYMALDNQPFSCVENPGLKYLLSKFDPSYNIKAGTTFSRSKLPELHKNVKACVEEQLKKDFPDLAGAGFSTDLWTSRNNENYQALTLHYIGKCWTLKSWVVGCFPFPGHHTADKIARKLDHELAKLEDLGLKANTTCVTDQAANMKKAVTNSQMDANYWCVDHILHLVVTGSIEKVPVIQIAMKKCTDLASHTHRSSVSQDRIKDEVEDLNSN